MIDKTLPPYEESTSNVLADLGLPNPVQEQLKAQLSREIHRIVKASKLTQAQAAKLLGIHQSQFRTSCGRGRPGAYSRHRGGLGAHTARGLAPRLPKQVLPVSVGCFKSPTGAGYICP